MAAPFISKVPALRAPSTSVQRIYYGVPSCGPLLQHSLLLAMRDQSPQLYARLVAETGVTLQKTESLALRRTMLSSAGALMIFKLVATAPKWREIVHQAAESLLAQLYSDLPFSVKFALNNLPRPLRVRLAVALLDRKMPHIAGSTSHLVTYNRQGNKLYVQVKEGLFADVIETRAAAREFYAAVVQALFWHFGRIQCNVAEVRSQLILAHECWYSVGWDEGRSNGH